MPTQLTWLDLDYVRMHAMWHRLINQLQRVRRNCVARFTVRKPCHVVVEYRYMYIGSMT